MRKMVDIPHASLTYQDGLSAVTTGPFGGFTVWIFFSFSLFNEKKISLINDLSVASWGLLWLRL